MGGKRDNKQMELSFILLFCHVTICIQMAPPILEYIFVISYTFHLKIILVSYDRIIELHSLHQFDFHTIDHSDSLPFQGSYERAFRKSRPWKQQSRIDPSTEMLVA
jgi:hypothetical protein